MTARAYHLICGNSPCVHRVARLPYISVWVTGPAATSGSVPGCIPLPVKSNDDIFNRECLTNCNADNQHRLATT